MYVLVILLLYLLKPLLMPSFLNPLHFDCKMANNIWHLTPHKNGKNIWKKQSIAKFNTPLTYSIINLYLAMYTVHTILMSIHTYVSTYVTGFAKTHIRFFEFTNP